jgi:hypothetical protein
MLTGQAKQKNRKMFRTIFKLNTSTFFAYGIFAYGEFTSRCFIFYHFENVVNDLANFVTDAFKILFYPSSET